MSFEPIAIVGRGTILPGALDPDAFWDNIAAGRMSLSRVPEGRWRLTEALTGPEDGTWSDVGGYVSGFPLDGSGLDPQFQWVLHGVRAALREAGQDEPAPRAGLVLGNLSFPTAGMAEYAEEVWRGSGRRPDARNRFMSGLPAHLAAQALGLGAGAFALDAACASSLYAVKLACDRLHDRSADLMIAGAVNCADDLFIHVGFTALSALSRTGRSRPFHRGADGLVPAEGAAFVALARLPDAVAAGRPILGVIRGVGLSNDGRGAGMLVPAEEGQERAMRAAYEMAGVAPESVTLLECHATGTGVGDAVEVRSTARVFAGHRGLAIGSAKSNVGHLVTAAGVAGLLKVLGAMRAGIRPATLHADEPIEALDGTPLRLLHEAEEWTGPRRAAVSAFGFGGNNAHLIVDAWDGSPVSPAPVLRRRRDKVAIVAIGARVGDGDGVDAVRRNLFSGSGTPRREHVDVALDGLRFPPLDLRQTLAQQLLVLEAARETVSGLGLPRERTMVLVGMGTDPEVARYGARWRSPAGTRDAVAPALRSAGVLGTMPNIVANRLNAFLDVAGPSFTVSAEEASGLVALEIAARALRTGEVDAAVVGAVDLSCEPVHEAALADLGIDRTPGDAAVVLVLKRLGDAECAGEPVIALLDKATAAAADLTVDTAPLFGNAHAAKGLVDVAAAALALHHRARPRHGAPADPAFDQNTAEVVVAPIQAPPARVRLRAHASAAWVADRPPRLHVYAGGDRTSALTALDADRESSHGPARLVLLAADETERAARAEAARAWLTGGGPQPEGVAFRAAPIAGEVAFVFTGGLAAYPGMGRELLLAFPHLVERIEAGSGSLRELAGWAFDGPASAPREVLDQIWGTALLSQVHAAIGREVLGIAPHAALGYSAGESNALVALGAWTDMRELVQEMTTSGVFSRQVAGEFAAIRRAWARDGIVGDRWRNYLVGADPDQVRKVLREEPAVHLVAVNAPDSVVIGGELTACERTLRRLDAAYHLPIPYELAVHVPELGEVRDDWWRLHFRPTTPPPGVRFYSCAIGGSYTPNAESVADVLTAQAIGPMDFAGTVEKAWSDGVRVFLEHGPKGMCTDWIRRTLAGREHLAVALDSPDGRSVRHLFRVAAELVAAGVPVDVDALRTHLATAAPPVRDRGRVLTLPAHPPAASLPEHASATVMARAPQLPPVIADPPAPIRAGIAFDRGQLEHLASGRISDLFGQLFKAQDGYTRQCRMPGPPMLLADRVTGIDAVPGSMGTGTIWTETDVTPDAWYLDATGRMPAGIQIEAGQADLLLISWLGADLHTMGERVYRLLGCELTFHGSPPVPGDTLRYEIHIDGHAEHNDVHLFFFHYDCHIGDELRLTVRGGQAGFFTDAELAASAGVVWDPRRELPPPSTADPPAVGGAPRTYDADSVRAFAEGRPAECFGPAWDPARAHVRTPRIGSGDMQLLRTVEEFDPAGGPWGRGYLRAGTPISPDDWFFAGHFKNDPCMPGTLMFEGCLQAMSFYLAACGFTLANDGWRFEPVPGQAYPMRCRGQVTPDSRSLTYEVFVSELVAGPEPTVYADVLCAVDGVKAFHAKRVGLRLVPDWPLDQWRDELVTRDDKPVATAGGVRFDHESLLACAWGRPTQAFGELYRRFDGHRRVARLPGPPYHFVTRITAVDGPLGGMRAGSAVTAEYDMPADAWYFAANAERTMPLSVLMEVALQPCGWLASYAGCAVEIDKDLLFRNLDGTGTITGAVTPETGVIRTHARLRDISCSGTMIIVSFDVECFAGDVSVFRLHTVFGFFPPEAFVDQPGLPCTAEERAALAAPTGPTVDLTTRPAKYCGGALRLPGPMLLMLDRITGYDPTGGAAGLGRVTGEKDVAAGEWFFRAHFFQDPVQPGSLGIEALYQLLQWYLLERGAGAGMAAPQFEILTGNRPLVWKYRGQVAPYHHTISSELEVTEYGEDADGRYALAKAWLWVDGKRIYRSVDIGVRVRDAAPAPDEETLDAAGWLADHRPTWTVPVLPMMSAVDRLVGAAGRPGPVALTGVELRLWIPVISPTRLTTRRSGDDVRLLVWREARTAALSRFEPFAAATVATPGPRPQPFPPLSAADSVDDVYGSGALFHGPAFHYVTEVRRGPQGASGTLDANRGAVPYGRAGQGLLDAATHVIPHDRFQEWAPDTPSGMVAYPHRITRFELFEALPRDGEVQVEARFAGFDGEDRRYPLVDLQLVRDGRVLVALRLVEILMPTGAFGAAGPRTRRDFLRDHRYASGIGLSRTEHVTRLSYGDVAQCDWLGGTVAHAYGLPPTARGVDHLAVIAVKDHIARQLGSHPTTVEVSADLTRAHHAGREYHVHVEQAADHVTVTDASTGRPS
ncbi:beta-ketoacyl synthase N-terminal-like domain-containing protein [Micromonospora sp. CB01531]|uniref:beta-ketoacyl synthase N-terminal-like domain-containing protein n=1 Tax=Micromonospora sp. CB01531 TaxID=1718947 RepID=UPI00093B83CF|nr:beta-ketoacyl synthase N-terminal-like domain-containing protein [Micromonospora sp. CB01531]